MGGLKGGQSGADIHLGRGNSNKILGRVLNGLKTEFWLASFEGGSKDNAIPREAFAKVFVAAKDSPALTAEIAAIEAALKEEFAEVDCGVFVRVSSLDSLGGAGSLKVFDDSTKKAVLDLILGLPFGVSSMSAELDGVVETSNNMGVVKVSDDGEKLLVSCSVRSLAASGKTGLCDKIAAVGAALGASYEIAGGYPGWEYNPVSPLREVFKKVYFERFGKEAVVTSIHAGLECGIFADEMPGVDMVSVGPDLFDLHTPDERADVASVERVYEYLVEVLGKL